MTNNEDTEKCHKCPFSLLYDMRFKVKEGGVDEFDFYALTFKGPQPICSQINYDYAA